MLILIVNDFCLVKSLKTSSPNAIQIRLIVIKCSRHVVNFSWLTMLVIFFFYELICISVHGEQLCEHSKNLGQSCGSDMLIGAPPQGQKFFKKKKNVPPPALLCVDDDDYFLLVFWNELETVIKANKTAIIMSISISAASKM